MADGVGVAASAMPARRICIHGHFYQPPRENPFLAIVEREASAAPFHDWNERITAECYRPNAAARILDAEGRIAELHDNYADISFNFGATLLGWAAEHAPDVYAAIIAADRAGAARRGGHGPALAQPWVHAILPLANERDRNTLVHWGIVDFEHRFGRRPEGMWLPETAVDEPTLETLAAHGISFTVLAPRQAAAVREMGQGGGDGDGGDWGDVVGERVDPTVAYRLPLPSGASIVAYFYDGGLARAIAFEDLLTNGDVLAERLLSAARTGDAPRVVHVATDGESYGHHHRHGEMGLAWALRKLRVDPDVRLTVYGEDLAAFPPRHEARIAQPSSWSCVHGVERWRSDCGCETGGIPGWSQAWRAPLRDALDWLRDTLTEPWEARAKQLFDDPWAARDDYVTILLDRSPAAQDTFLTRHLGRRLGTRETVTALTLLELQFDLLAMYTSCGWFFAEPSGIETGIALRHAGRAVRLAASVLDFELDHAGDLEAALLDRLAPMRSNLGDLGGRSGDQDAEGDGRELWRLHVRAQEITVDQIAAAYAARTMFSDALLEAGAALETVYGHIVERLDHTEARSGRARLVVGRARFTSVRTREHRVLSYGALHLGAHDIVVGARALRDGEHRRAATGCVDAFGRGGLADAVRELDRWFAGHLFSLGSLPADTQALVLDALVAVSLRELEEDVGAADDDRSALVRILTSQGSAVPPALQFGAAVSLGAELRRILAADPVDLGAGARVAAEAHALGLEPALLGLEAAIDTALDRAAAAVRTRPRDAGALEQLAGIARLARGVPGGAGRWRAENTVVALRDAGSAREALRRAAADLGIAVSET